MAHWSWDQGHTKRGLFVVLALVLVLVCGWGLYSHYSAERAREQAEELALAQAAQDEENKETIRAGLNKCLEPLVNPTLDGLQILVAHADAESLQSLPTDYGITVAELLMHLLRGFHYEVEEVTLGDQVASARLCITVLDAKQSVNAALVMTGDPETAQTISEMYKAEGEEAHAEFLRYLVSILYACLDASDAYTTAEVQLNLSKHDNVWEISSQSLDELLDTITAGMELA